MVVFCQDDAAEIVEAAPAVSALVLLAKGIGVLVPIFFNTIGGAFRATNALWPPLFSKEIEALLWGNKIVNADIQSLCGSSNHRASPFGVKRSQNNYTETIRKSRIFSAGATLREQHPAIPYEPSHFGSFQGFAS